MPRNASGTYTLPIGAFSPGGLIKSGDHNSNYSDIATALTQSLATTGVSTMTGPIKAATGNASAPGITFSGSLTDGFYLSGTHQIGVTNNGFQTATFNSDNSVGFNGAATFGGNVTYNGTATINGAVTLNATSYTFGAGAAAAFWAGIASNFTIEVIFDGGGNAIAGNSSLWVEVPCNCTIKRVTLLADQTGSIGVWIGFGSYAGFVGGASGFTSINNVSAVYPTPTETIGSAAKTQDSSLTNWTTSLTAGEIIGFIAGGTSNVGNPATTIQRLTVSLLCERTGS